jgi:GPH family glycoside/pentoside/hexuronide:cation symporter
MVTYTYFWQLNATQTSLLFAGPIILAVLLSAVFSGALNRLLEKQQVLRLTCALSIINLLWLTPLKLLDLLPDNSSLVMALICANWTVHTTMIILRVIVVQSMLADIVDEQELATGRRQEGVIFAAAFFSAKFVSAFSYLIAGPFLDLIGLEAGARPDEVSDTVIRGLGLIMGPGLAIIMLLPMWMSFKITTNHASHVQVREALSKRRLAIEISNNNSVSTAGSR